MKSSCSSARTKDLAVFLCSRFGKVLTDWMIDPDRFFFKAFSLLEMVSIEELNDRSLTEFP